MEQKYTPVSREFYEELEDLALARKHCEVVFEQEGARVTELGVIDRIYEEDGVEFLRMDSGLHIRLDRLIRVDGKIPPEFC
jgi:Rho-binding antiterminator